MKKNRHLFEIVSLILAIVILMGCTAKPAATPQPTGPVKVQYWSNGWFAQSIDARKASVDKFNQEHQGKIQVEYIQNGAAAGGGIACLMEWYDVGAIDWYRKGYVNDLRPYITPEIKALMPEASWKARTFADDGAIAMNGTVMGDLLLTL